MCGVEDLKPVWSQISIVEKMKSVPLFEEFDLKLLTQLASQAKELVFEKDELITREGDLARYIYIITRGRAIETS